MTDPDRSNRATGALLLARLLRGPQELSTTDTASPLVRAMWHRLGGETVHLGSVSWVRVFRPSAVARNVLGSRKWWLRAATRPAWLAADSAFRRLIGSLYPATEAEVSAEQLEPLVAGEHLTKIAASFRVRPVYEPQYLEWLFEELSRFGEGTPVRRLIRSRGRAVGSYVYLLQRDGISRVLQVAAREEDAEAVLDDLFEHARAHGAAALRGRVEPHLQQALRRRGVFLFPAGAYTLVHSRHSELLHAIQCGDALNTLLDGEWWSGMRSPTWRESSRSTNS
jgi:hypothetical protein